MSGLNQTMGFSLFELDTKDNTDRLELIGKTLSGRNLAKLISAAVKPMTALMKTYAPVRTGALRRSIRQRTQVNRKTGMVNVRSGLIYNRNNLRGYLGGVMMERGTIYIEPRPYIKPAYDEMIDKVKRDLTKRLMNEVEGL